MILLDTSILIESLTGLRRSLPDLTRVIDQGERLALCTLVAYEWLRGPRTEPELSIQQALFPLESALLFAAEDAEIAAKLYKSIRRARGREADLAVAACAIRNKAELWTLNRADFTDIPGLTLFQPQRLRP